MATQIIEVEAPSGMSLTAKLYAAGSDTPAFTASSVAEATNRKGVYRCTFSGVSAGYYQLVLTSGSTAVAVWWGYAEDTASTFQFGAASGYHTLNALSAAGMATDAVGSLELSAGAASEVATAVRAELTTELNQIGGISTNVATLLTRIPSTLFSGITYLSRWLGAIAGKTADTATRAEINATAAGVSYNETTDSLQALKDAGIGGTMNANIVSANGSPVLAGDFNFAVSAGGKMVNNVLDIVPGDEYSADDDTAISFTDSRFPDLDLFTSAELTVYVAGVAVVDHISTLLLDEATKTISVELTEAQTGLLLASVGEDAQYDLELVRADTTRKTIARGPARVLDPLG